MIIKADKNKLYNVLNKFVMSETQKLVDCLLKFDENGMSASAMTKTNTTAVYLFLAKDFFSEYNKDIGNIGILSMPDFIAMIKRFKKEVTIKKEGNLLTLSEGKKTIFMELVDDKFIENNARESKLEYDTSFTLDAEVLKKDLFDFDKTGGKDEKNNKNFRLTIITKTNNVKFIVNTKYKLEYDYDIDGIEKEHTVSFGPILKEALNNANGNLKMFVKTDYPIKIEDIDLKEGYILTYIVAPFGGEEE